MPQRRKGTLMHVLLHIGSPKAGSTTIQTALRLNRAALADHGVLAWEPDSRHGPPARTLANVFTRPAKRLMPRERLFFDTRDQATAWSAQCWDHLAAEVAQRRPALTILSSEQFFDMPQVRPVIDRLATMFSGVTILAYVRDPVAMYRSSLDQIIRDGERFADLPLPADLVLRGHETLANWQARLGAPGVIVRLLDRSALTGGDLLSDLAQQIGTVLGRPVDLRHRPAPENESLCAAATLWLLAANEAFVRFNEGGDRELLKRRFALVRRLAEAGDLAALPKLRDPVGPLADTIRAANAEASAWYAAQGLQIVAPPGDSQALPDEAQRAALRDWLVSQANPAALARVLAVAIA